MDLYLIKKDTFHVLLPYQTEAPIEDRPNIKEGYGFTCIEILQTNMDGKGSALIKTMDVEIIRYNNSYSVLRGRIIKDFHYSIINYIELETMLLSKDWIFCDDLTHYSGDRRIEKIIKRSQKVIKR